MKLVVLEKVSLVTDCQRSAVADNLLGKIKDSTKLLITPYMAWSRHEARECCAKEVYQNIKNFLIGKERNRVV